MHALGRVEATAHARRGVRHCGAVVGLLIALTACTGGSAGPGEASRGVRSLPPTTSFCGAAAAVKESIDASTVLAANDPGSSDGLATTLRSLFELFPTIVAGLDAMAATAPTAVHPAVDRMVKAYEPLRALQPTIDGVIGRLREAAGDDDKVTKVLASPEAVNVLETFTRIGDDPSLDGPASEIEARVSKDCAVQLDLTGG